MSFIPIVTRTILITMRIEGEERKTGEGRRGGKRKGQKRRGNKGR